MIVAEAKIRRFAEVLNRVEIQEGAFVHSTMQHSPLGSVFFTKHDVKSSAVRISGKNVRDRRIWAEIDNNSIRVDEIDVASVPMVNVRTGEANVDAVTAKNRRAFLGDAFCGNHEMRGVVDPRDDCAFLCEGEQIRSAFGFFGPQLRVKTKKGSWAIVEFARSRMDKSMLDKMKLIVGIQQSCGSVGQKIFAEHIRGTNQSDVHGFGLVSWNEPRQLGWHRVRGEIAGKTDGLIFWASAAGLDISESESSRAFIA